MAQLTSPLSLSLSPLARGEGKQSRQRQGGGPPGIQPRESDPGIATPGSSRAFGTLSEGVQEPLHGRVGRRLRDCLPSPRAAGRG